MAQIERVLLAAQGRDRGPEKLCLVTVIGHRYFTPSGWVLVDPGIEPIVVYAAGPNDAKPTAAQLAACLELWSTYRAAPDAFTFPASGMPTIPRKSTPSPESTPATDKDTETDE